MATLLDMVAGNITPSMMMGQLQNADTPPTLSDQYAKPDKNSAVASHCSRFCN